MNWPAADGSTDQVLKTDGAGQLGWVTAGGGGGFTTIIDREADGTYGIGSGVLAAATATGALRNIAIGTDAGKSFAGADGNVLIGDKVFDAAIGGDRNVLIGDSAGSALSGTGCSYNIGIGYRAAGGLVGGTSASGNVGLGDQALRSVQGSHNVAAGWSAGVDVSTGSTNTLLGRGAGDNLTTGSKNIMICAGQTSFPSNTADRQIMIGCLVPTNQQVPFINGIMGDNTDVDVSSENITITGPSAYFFATTNVSGGDMVVQGGVAKSTGAGVGGDLILRGGAGGDTGSKGEVQIDGLSWPTADGSTDQVLKTDGAGQLGWVTAGGGSTWNVEDTTNGNYGHGLNALDSVTVSSGLNNIAIGENAGTALTTGDRNVLIGSQAGKSISAASDSVLIGEDAGTLATAGSNVCVGRRAGRVLSSGGNNTAIGHTALGANQTSYYNVAIGDQALSAVTGASNVGIGRDAGDNLTSGSDCIAIGANTGLLSATDSFQIVVGGNSLVPAISGYLGTNADTDWSGKTLTVTGPSAMAGASTNLDAGDLIVQGGVAATTGIGIGGDLILKGGAGGDTGSKGEVQIDGLSWPTADGTTDQVLKTDGAGQLGWVTAGGGGGGWSVDDDTYTNYAHGIGALDSVVPSGATLGNDNIAIGENALTAVTSGRQNVAIGSGAGASMTDIESTFIGYQAGATLGVQQSNTFVGHAAGRYLTNNEYSVAIGGSCARDAFAADNFVAVGYAAMGFGPGDSSVAVGYLAGQSASSKNHYVAVGSEAGKAGCSYSVALGSGALSTATGNGNIGLGYGAGNGIVSGSQNVCIGYLGYNNITSADRCIGIGTGDFDSATADDQISIGGAAFSVPVINGYLGAYDDIDASGRKLTITGASARTNASTNQDGGDLELRPGQPASGGGSAGNILITDLPTSDPIIAGALYNSSGTLMISAG